MSSVKYPVVGGRIVRGTRVDSCGLPAWGDKTQIASEGIVSVAQTANYDDGTEKTVTNFRGRKCVYVPGKAELLNLSLDVVFCAVDPEFYTLLTGFPVEYDAVTGDAVGYRIDRSVRPSDIATALELWADTQGSTVCDAIDGLLPFGYMLWPFLSGGRVGDYTIEDNAATFSVTGMLTQDGSQWGDGPYNVIQDAAGDPSPLLTPIAEKEHSLVRRTLVPPPEETSGLIPLDDPDDTDATTGTAGIPGVWNGVRPFDLDALLAGAVTASPNTAWTAGQYLYLGDGTKTHWSGTAWVTGAAV